MFTHTFTQSWQSGGNALTKTFTRQGGAENNIEEAIPANSSNRLVAFTADVSQLQSLVLSADVAMTVKTNSSGSPANTFTLAAGEPFFWTGVGTLRDTGGTAVTTDITALYITTTEAGTFNLRSLSDPTV